MCPFLVIFLFLTTLSKTPDKKSVLTFGLLGDQLSMLLAKGKEKSQMAIFRTHFLEQKETNQIFFHEKH